MKRKKSQKNDKVLWAVTATAASLAFGLGIGAGISLFSTSTKRSLGKPEVGQEFSERTPAAQRTSGPALETAVNQPLTAAPITPPPVAPPPLGGTLQTSTLPTDSGKDDREQIKGPPDPGALDPETPEMGSHPPPPPQSNLEDAPRPGEPPPNSRPLALPSLPDIRESKRAELQGLEKGMDRAPAEQKGAFAQKIFDSLRASGHDAEKVAADPEVSRIIKKATPFAQPHH